MSARGSRLSESSSQSEGEDQPPPPPRPAPKPISRSKPAAVAVPAAVSDVSTSSFAAKEAELDAKYAQRYTMEDPGYSESVSKGILPAPVLHDYQGRSYRGGGRGGGSGYGGPGGSRGGGGGYDRNHHYNR